MPEIIQEAEADDVYVGEYDFVGFLHEINALQNLLGVYRNMALGKSLGLQSLEPITQLFAPAVEIVPSALKKQYLGLHDLINIEMQQGIDTIRSLLGADSLGHNNDQRRGPEDY